MKEKVNGFAALVPGKVSTPKELGEEILLARDDYADDALAVDSGARCEGMVCNAVKADATFQSIAKTSARSDGSPSQTEVGPHSSLESLVEGQLQEHSLLVLASECFLYCQDIMMFALAIGSLYFWRYVRASQSGETCPTKGCEDAWRDCSDGKKSKPVRTQSSLDVNALVKAMYSENKDDLKKMLDERSVNACDELCCCTALHVAAHYKCVEAAVALLDRGADVDIKDVWDETPLHFAARVGHTEICVLLLQRGADVNAANAQGWTPLLVAAEAGMEDTCEVLLDRAAHVGGVDEEDVPPLLNRLLQLRIVSGLASA